MSAQPIYLGGSFGLLHEPVGPPPSGLGVVLAPAFGWEATASYRPLRAWAEDLAGRGHVALRIDLPGTGDSAGGPRDADRLSAWQAAVAEAANVLRARRGVRRVAVIGVSLGGLLALLALLAEGAAIDDIVAWATPARGRTLVRELEAFATFEASVLPKDGPYAPAPWPPGSSAVAGYHLDAATASALSQVDLSEIAPGALAHRRVMLLGRAGVKVDERLRRSLTAAGADVSVGDGSEFSSMTAEPQVAAAPRAAFDRVGAWLAQPAASALPEPAEVVEPTTELELGTGEAGIRERPLYLDAADGHLFGVLTEPAQPQSSGVCLLLLNAGAINHCGPNRMWVEIARRWAARGVSSFRVDLGGIGESDGDDARYRDVASFYVPDLVEQVPAVIDGLVAGGVRGRFVAVGLCSGAYWGFHAATEDARIAAVLMVNPRSLLWDPRVELLRDAKRVDRLVRRTSWRKLRHRGLGAFTSPRVVAGAIARRAIDAPRAARAARQARRSGGDELDLLFDRLRDQPTRALLVFSGDEPLYEELEAEGRLARMSRWPNLSVQLMARAPETHTLRPAWLQRRLHEIVDEEVAGVLLAAAEQPVRPASPAPGVTGIRES